MNEVFRSSENIAISMRNFFKVNHPFRNNNTRQNGPSYIAPAIWNRIPEILKKIKNLSIFKHNLKHHFLNVFSNPNL